MDDLFVPDFPFFVNFMYLNQDSFGSGIYPKTSCEFNCTSKGFSCNFLDLAVRQSLQGLSCDIFDKCSQPEYAGIEMIRMPHVHSNISVTAKLGVINSQSTVMGVCIGFRWWEGVVREVNDVENKVTVYFPGLPN